MRGAGHIHGVLWQRLDSMERDGDGNLLITEDENGYQFSVYTFASVRDIFKKLQARTALTAEEHDALANYIDQFVSVDLIDKQVSNIVSQVNMHRHTKTCRKYGSKECRFNYPKFPTDRTRIACPYELADIKGPNMKSLSAERKKKYYKALERIRGKVKKILLQEEKIEEILGHPEHLQIDELCKLAGVDKLKYYESLQYSDQSYTVHYKRRVSEINVNTYNKEWIRAWNANMDFQICLDCYAIITYITDYITKTDNQLIKSLNQALKKAGNIPL